MIHSFTSFWRHPSGHPLSEIPLTPYLKLPVPLPTLENICLHLFFFSAGSPYLRVSNAQEAWNWGVPTPLLGSIPGSSA